MRPAGTSTSRGRGRRTARPVAGGRGSSRPGEHRALALIRPWPLVGGGSAYLPRGPVARATPGPATGRARPRRGAGRGGAAPRAATASTSSPRTRRSRPPTRRTWRRSTRPGFHAIAEIQPSRHRMALALPAGGRRGRRVRRASRRRPASGSGGPSATAWSSCATTHRCGRRRDGRRASAARPRPARPPSPLLRPAARDGRAARVRVRRPGRVRRLVDARARGRTPRLSRGPRRAPRTATCSAASSCTATAGGSRRRTPADRAERRQGSPGRACTCSAGGPSSWRSPRGATRWTSAASTSPGARRPPAPASRCTACTSTSARSGPSGWRWPARRSGSASPVRYAFGRVATRLARTPGAAGSGR